MLAVTSQNICVATFGHMPLYFMHGKRYSEVMPPKSLKVPPLVPRKFAGQWIAWVHKKTRIIANASTFGEARQAACEKGESSPVIAKVPRADTWFVGGV